MLAELFRFNYPAFPSSETAAFFPPAGSMRYGVSRLLGFNRVVSAQTSRRFVPSDSDRSTAAERFPWTQRPRSDSGSVGSIGSVGRIDEREESEVREIGSSSPRSSSSEPCNATGLEPGFGCEGVCFQRVGWFGSRAAIGIFGSVRHLRNGCSRCQPARPQSLLCGWL